MSIATRKFITATLRSDFQKSLGQWHVNEIEAKALTDLADAEPLLAPFYSGRINLDTSAGVFFRQKVEPLKTMLLGKGWGNTRGPVLFDKIFGKDIQITPDLDILVSAKLYEAMAKYEANSKSPTPTGAIPADTELDAVLKEMGFKGSEAHALKELAAAAPVIKAVASNFPSSKTPENEIYWSRVKPVTEVLFGNQQEHRWSQPLLFNIFGAYTNPPREMRILAAAKLLESFLTNEDRAALNHSAVTDHTSIAYDRDWNWAG